MKPQSALMALMVALPLGLALPADAHGAPQDASATSPPATDASSDPPTAGDVRRESEEAVDAMRAYSTAERLAAEERAREAMERMRQRIAALQDDVRGSGTRLDADARGRRDQLLEAARVQLEQVRARAAELDAAGDKEWQRARERFLDSYRQLARNVQDAAARAMPGQPLPPSARDGAQEQGDEPPVESEEGGDGS